MSTKHPGEIAAGLAALSRDDRARILAEAKRMRAEEIDKLLRSAGRGLVRLGSALAQPITAAIRATGLPRRIALARLWRGEFLRVRAELEANSGRELMADLRLTRSEIPEIAAEAADRRVAAFVRAHPEHRREAHRWRGRQAVGVGHAGA